MNPVYKALARVLWILVKLVGQAVIVVVKLIAPTVARRLQRQLTHAGQRITGSGRRQGSLTDR